MKYLITLLISFFLGGYANTDLNRLLSSHTCSSANTPLNTQSFIKSVPKVNEDNDQASTFVHSLFEKNERLLTW